jgi:hypothetical protein
MAFVVDIDLWNCVFVVKQFISLVKPMRNDPYFNQNLIEVACSTLKADERPVAALGDRIRTTQIA